MNEAREGQDRPTGPCIGILPLGPVPGVVCEGIVSYIRAVSHLDAVIFSPFPEPAYAHDACRNQYDAALVIERLEAAPFHGCLKVIGILNVDLFIPIFTHVYGEAREGGRCALASMFRLRKGNDGKKPVQNVILERTAKVAVHEMGHLFMVPHCADNACLMHFSMDLTELDATPIRFCRYCDSFFRSSVERILKVR